MAVPRCGGAVMRKLDIADAEVMRIAIQQEIARSDQLRYDHRLHGLLLVTGGHSCQQVAELCESNLATELLRERMASRIVVSTTTYLRSSLRPPQNRTAHHRHIAVNHLMPLLHHPVKLSFKGGTCAQQ